MVLEDLIDKFQFIVPLCLFYHNSESAEIACFLSRFPTFRIYGTGAYLGVDLTMFRAFPEEEVARAIELSGLSALVAERGALALCGENGSALSGGERQRVSIARRAAPALRPHPGSQGWPHRRERQL